MVFEINFNFIALIIAVATVMIVCILHDDD
jgi:hypothetical protein